MIAFFTKLAASVALKLTPVGAFFKSVPRWVWIALAVAALVGLGAWRHSAAVSDLRETSFKAGEAAANDRHAKKATEWLGRINGIARTIRSQTDETNRHIAADYDALRVRGPGRAACPYTDPASFGASGHVEGRGAADAPVAGMPNSERPALIALPFAELIGFAERCDLNRAEALSWREDKRLQQEAWEKQNAAR